MKTIIKLTKTLIVFCLSLVSLFTMIACDFTEDPGSGSAGGNTNRQIPVYQGMTITQATDSSNLSVRPPHYKNDGNGNGNGDNGNHNGWYKGDYEEEGDVDVDNPFPENGYGENIENEIESSLDIIGTDKEIYYATPNEDIYINVFISNPDNFEILSFTLNGNKYSSYMFEYGSTMERLILKYNVGSVSGVQDYTIDAIKYVDGTEIKDVKMDGEKTIRAGVRVDNQVVANVTNQEVATDYLAFDVNLIDNDGLIAFSQGKALVVLYDGDNILDTKVLATGENSIKFEGLQENTVYQYAVIGYYDALVNGLDVNMLYKDAFKTESTVLFDDITIGYGRISFNLNWYEKHEDKSLQSLILFKDGQKVQDLACDATTVEGLLSESQYQLVATYLKDGVEKTITLDFLTAQRVAPTVQINLTEINETDFSFELIKIDEENLLQITKIELVHETDGTFVADSIDVRSFSNLSTLIYTDCELYVYYEYDLNDGKGKQTAFVNKRVAFHSEGLEYSITNDGAIITGIGTCTDAYLIIPEEIEGYKEVSIGDYAFYDCSDLTTVVIPDSVTSIGVSAFKSCSSLTSVNYWGTIDQWVEINFADDYANPVYYTKQLKIKGEVVTEVNLTTATKISAYAFNGCTTLTSIIISNTVTSIGWDAFYGCDSLTSIVIPESVTTIESGMQNCPLENATIPGFVFSYINVSNLKTLVVTSGKIHSLSLYNCTKLKSVVIGDGVTTIGNTAFGNCTALTSVEIGDGVTTIGDYAFYGCWSLKTIEIGSSVISIGIAAFSGCEGLTSVVIPDSVTTIGEQAFYSCTSLTSIAIGDGLNSISDYVFYGCYNLKSIDIPNSVVSIGYSAFCNCYALTSVVIPTSVTSFTISAFFGCEALTKVAYLGTIDQWVEIDFGVGGNPLNYADELIIDDVVVTEVVLSTATKISSYAFQYYESLMSVVIGDSVNSIGFGAFEGCAALKSIVISDSVTSIEGSFDCQFENVTAPAFAFQYISYLSNVQKVVVTSGEIPSYRFSGCANLISVEIDDDVTSVGLAAFRDCSNLSSVVIGSGVTSISNGTFYGCYVLKSIIIGGNVTSIGDEAFYGCYYLESVIIGDNVTSIGDEAFYNCFNLVSINYCGTEEQWKTISKGSDWDSGTGDYTIIYNYTGE